MKKDIFMATLAVIVAFVAFAGSLAIMASLIADMVTGQNVNTLDEMLRCGFAVFFALGGCFLAFLVWLYVQAIEERMNTAVKR